MEICIVYEKICISDEIYSLIVLKQKVHLECQNLNY